MGNEYGGQNDLPGEYREEQDREDEPTDIRTDLEDVFENDLDFEGSFYFSRTYHDAPNPLLRLNALGHIGLPLSQREAKYLAQHSRQAPFGVGTLTHTVVDTNVRDIWEMDASEVHLDSPKWKPFLERVVREACEGLGVDVAASRPHCNLHKLLLYQTGSHLLPHQEAEKVDGMFATILIVLPSPFTGGAAHLSHADNRLSWTKAAEV